ncbi:M24 family metallopeptidase [Allobacillus sp. GCM10007491]|uniref:Aminopeptidase P family protein n=1 Tax=Allobacillus saliphilus TaxID=2912308 RepID=A0A941CVC3_9BACI|nr:Xaa-Pro peptidase family protein [Allobacillus saliphilus]MBR7553791.1 aminopeptidase P family protein [Allobacillus saliphilus]
MERIEQLTKELRKEQMDAVFMTSKANLYYYTNIYAEAHERLLALYVDVRGNVLLICPSLEEEDVKNAGFTEDVIYYGDHENPWELLKKSLSGISGINRLAIEKEVLNVNRFEQLKSVFHTADLVDGQTILNNLRLIKDDQEYRYLKEAAEYADFAIETATKHIEVGQTELSLIAEIEFALKKEGIREMSFGTTVLTGEKSAAPHGNPDLTKMKSGDFVLMDLGVVHKGYCSDITRTVAIGEVSDQQKDIYQTVLNAQKKALEVSQIGVPLGKIDRAAREVIEAAGYGEYFMHRIGHGLGIEVHEFPSLASNNDSLLQQGMCYTIEPGIYLPGVGGVRIEDDVFVTKQGAETLTTFTKDLIQL